MIFGFEFVAIMPPLFGGSDSPLVDSGVGEAKTTSEIFRDICFDAIITSDLPRAIRTAENMKRSRPLDIQISQAFRERAYGHYEGRTWKEYKKLYNDKVSALSEKEQKAFKLSEGIESDDELMDRFLPELKRIAVTNLGKTIMVVSHGGCIRMFLMYVGCYKYGTLSPGKFIPSGYVKFICNSSNFEIMEVKGIT